MTRDSYAYPHTCFHTSPHPPGGLDDGLEGTRSAGLGSSTINKAVQNMFTFDRRNPRAFSATSGHPALSDVKHISARQPSRECSAPHAPRRRFSIGVRNEDPAEAPLGERAACHPISERPCEQ